MSSVVIHTVVVLNLNFKHLLLFLLFEQTVYGMRFNIYSMAWYVDAAVARQEPLLQPFRSMSLAELQQSTDFYRAVSTEGAFDRTLMLKLAMTLKKDLLIQGLIEELPLKPRNSVNAFFDIVCMNTCMYVCMLCNALLIVFLPTVLCRNCCTMPVTSTPLQSVRKGWRS